MPAAVVTTRSGKVSGFETDGVQAYLGIPYGASTAGEHRFQPPRPPASWSGVREATQFGPAVLVGEPAAAVFGVDPEPQSEDSLVLNVWTRGIDGRRPVMVWLHGGGFGRGSGRIEGAELARTSDVVVVSVNHRLGLLGFLYLGDVAPERYPAANVGMLDLVAALEWVRDEIAGFGGDPANVTIFGISGGGSKVNTLCAMPEARGLFHRAICQSGVLPTGRTREQATAVTEAVLANAGVDPARPDAIAAVAPERLLAAHEQFLARARRGADVTSSWTVIASGGTQLGPVVDGVSLPEPVFDAIAHGSNAGVPMIIGSAEDEPTSLAMGVPSFGALDADGLRALVEPLLGPELGSHLIAEYRDLRPGASDWQLFAAIMADWMFRIPAIRLAEAQLAGGGGAPVYQYLITLDCPLFDGALGAYHGIDMQYTFLQRTSPLIDAPVDEVMMRVFSSAWRSFAAAGDPNGPDVPKWPAYSTDERATMLFDSESRVELDPLAAERRVWEQLEFPWFFFM